MKTREYEAMFLLDNAAAVADWDGTSGIVDQLLTKYGAEIVQTEKWDERKLAYEIRGHKRATYLVYFKAASDVAAKVTADASLNDKIVRMLILTLDEPIADHIKAGGGARAPGGGEPQGQPRGRGGRRGPSPSSSRRRGGRRGLRGAGRAGAHRRDVVPRSHREPRARGLAAASSRGDVVPGARVDAARPGRGPASGPPRPRTKETEGRPSCPATRSRPRRRRS
jgi:small subunit ribosomal protein S6